MIMKVKKSKKVNLENKRIIFLQIGTIVTLSIILLAFEWKTAEIDRGILEGKLFDPFDDELVDVTIQQKEIPKVPVIKKYPIIKEIPNDGPEPDYFPPIDADDPEGYNDPDFEYEESTECEEEVIFKVVEHMPSFPGGDKAFYKYLSKNLKYPQMAREAGIQGPVYINFIISKTGAITDAFVERGIGGGCDEEALRVINKMPDWNPGTQRTKAVKVQMTIPIHFKLL